MTPDRAPQAVRRLSAALAALVLVLTGLLANAAPARAYTDDYPWRTATTNSADSFGFTKRQCVSYAAWRLYKAGKRISNRQGWGSAYHWDEAARNLGRKVYSASYLAKVGSKPRVGWVAQWNAGEASKYYTSSGTGSYRAGSYGHVAYVAGVYSDGSVLVRQYNGTGTRTFSQMRVKAPRYIVF